MSARKYFKVPDNAHKRCYSQERRGAWSKAALVVQDPPVYHLVDTSTNGTCVNGVRLKKGDPSTLAEGDRIRLAAQTADPTKLVECAPVPLP